MLQVTGVCGQLRFIVTLAASMLLAAGAWAQSMQPPVGQPLPPQAVPTQVLPPEQFSTSGQASPPANPAQQAPLQPTPVPTAPQAAAPPEVRSNPGLIEEIGKLLKNSASGLSSTWQGSQQTIDAINSGAKGATDALISTTTQTMMKGRATCPVAGNGAPDCKAASEQLCKMKGYKTGSSVDIETAETCNAKVYISGRTGAPGECKTESFVTRALCQ